MTKHFLLYTKYAQRSILLKKVHRVVQINAERIKIHILVRTKNMHHDMLLKIVLLHAETSNFHYSFILLSNKQLFPVFQLLKNHIHDLLQAFALTFETSKYLHTLSYIQTFDFSGENFLRLEGTVSLKCSTQLYMLEQKTRYLK